MTLDELRAAYHANADYDADGGSTSKAQAFRTACRGLLLELPARAMQGTQQAEMRVELIERALLRVEAFLNGSTRVTYGDVSEFRG